MAASVGDSSAIGGIRHGPRLVSAARALKAKRKCMDTRIDGGPGENAGNAPRLLWMAMLVAFFLMAIRVASINSPVMGSDEYAYFHAAKYEASGEQLFALDPYLQRVDNKVYPWLYRA